MDVDADGGWVSDNGEASDSEEDDWVFAAAGPATAASVFRSQDAPVVPAADMEAAAARFALAGPWPGAVSGIGLPTTAATTPGFDDPHTAHWLHSRAIAAAAETLTNTMAAVLGLKLNAGVGHVPPEVLLQLGARTAAWEHAPCAPASHVLGVGRLRRLLGPRARAGLVSLALHTVCPSMAQAFWLHNTVGALQALYAAHTQALRNAAAVLAVHTTKVEQAREITQAWCGLIATTDT